jgi:hypothetical protein
MEDNDTAMAAFAMPAVDVVGREDPEAIGAEREFLAGPQENAATPLDDGVEFPIEAGMRPDGHGPETPNAATQVSQHRRARRDQIACDGKNGFMGIVNLMRNLTSL